MRHWKIATVAAGLALASACDLDGDFLFPGAIEGVPGIVHLGEIEPADVNTPAQVRDATLYGEVGPTGSAELGGVTFSFQGTGGHVCLWVDPETLFWNQSVSPQPNQRWGYPVNFRDDGDLNLYAGLGAYYNGSPGEEIGSFEVAYQDALGNPVTIALNECEIPSMQTTEGGHSGRGAPEFCTIRNTQPGVTYMGLLETWSLPIDDHRLGYGLLVTNGTCSQLRQASGAGHDECVILGESVDPSAPSAPGPWQGLDEVPSRAGSIEFEQAFCDPGGSMVTFCREEAEEKDCTDPEAGCFCGDPNTTPSAGSF